MQEQHPFSDSGLTDAEVEEAECAAVRHVGAEWTVVVSLTFAVEMRAEHAPLSVHAPVSPEGNSEGRRRRGRSVRVIL
jgi:hypothetical protein